MLLNFSLPNPFYFHLFPILDSSSFLVVEGKTNRIGIIYFYVVQTMGNYSLHVPDGSTYPLCSTNEAYLNYKIQYPLKSAPVSVKNLNIISDVLNLLIWKLPYTVIL